MQINFNMFHNSRSWVSIIHQLNGDILKRLVLLNQGHNSFNLSFDYCEENCTGQIFDEYQTVIGTFSLV